MKFTVSGVISLGISSRKFSKEIEAKTKNHAKELVYSLFGSKNGTKRNNIKITDVAWS